MPSFQRQPENKRSGNVPRKLFSGCLCFCTNRKTQRAEQERHPIFRLPLVMPSRQPENPILPTPVAQNFAPLQK
nr:hypothetical protein [uncultured Kingella sp.]